MRTMNKRERCPKHPGYILKTLYLQPLDITISHFAEQVGVSRKTISAIVNARKSVTPEMALRLSQAFPNTTPESWLTLQRNYDLWQAAHTTSAWKMVQAIPTELYEEKEAVLAHS